MSQKRPPWIGTLSSNFALWPVTKYNWCCCHCEAQPLTAYQLLPNNGRNSECCATGTIKLLSDWRHKGITVWFVSFLHTFNSVLPFGLWYPHTYVCSKFDIDITDFITMIILRQVAFFSSRACGQKFDSAWCVKLSNDEPTWEMKFCCCSWRHMSVGEDFYICTIYIHLPPPPPLLIPLLVQSLGNWRLRPPPIALAADVYWAEAAPPKIGEGKNQRLFFIY